VELLPRHGSGGGSLRSGNWRAVQSILLVVDCVFRSRKPWMGRTMGCGRQRQCRWPNGYPPVACDCPDSLFF
jgi:hypothetical protein